MTLSWPGWDEDLKRKEKEKKRKERQRLFFIFYIETRKTLGLCTFDLLSVAQDMVDCWSGDHLRKRASSKLPKMDGNLSAQRFEFVSSLDHRRDDLSWLLLLIFVLFWRSTAEVGTWVGQIFSKDWWCLRDNNSLVIGHMILIGSIYFESVFGLGRATIKGTCADP